MIGYPLKMEYIKMDCMLNLPRIGFTNRRKGKEEYNINHLYYNEPIFACTCHIFINEKQLV